MSAEVRLATLDAAPEALADGRLLVPLADFDDAVFSGGDDADVCVVTWPGGAVRGAATECYIVVRPA